MSMDWSLEVASRVAAAFAQQGGLGGEPFTLVTLRQMGSRAELDRGAAFRSDMASWHAFLQGYGIEAECPGSLEAADFVKQHSLTVVLCLKHGESRAVDTEIARRMSQWKNRVFDSRWQSPQDVGHEG